MVIKRILIGYKDGNLSSASLIKYKLVKSYPNLGILIKSKLVKLLN